VEYLNAGRIRSRRIRSHWQA